MTLARETLQAEGIKRTPFQWKNLRIAEELLYTQQHLPRYKNLLKNLEQPSKAFIRTRLFHSIPINLPIMKVRVLLGKYEDFRFSNTLFLVFPLNRRRPKLSGPFSIPPEREKERET